MTLSDFAEVNCMDIKQQLTPDIEKAVKQVLTRACADVRLTCGAVECARQLESDPDAVMLCILPEETDQGVFIEIQHTLIEAYCRENAIPVLKVEPTCLPKEVLLKYISPKPDNGSSSAHARLERKISYARDLNCFLIKTPDVMTPEDDMLKSICKQDPKKKHIVMETPS